MNTRDHMIFTGIMSLIMSIIYILLICNFAHASTEIQYFQETDTFHVYHCYEYNTVGYFGIITKKESCVSSTWEYDHKCLTQKKAMDMLDRMANFEVLNYASRNEYISKASCLKELK